MEAVKTRESPDIRLLVSTLLLLFLGLFSGWLMLVDDLHGLLVLFGRLGLLLKMSE